MRYLAIDLGDKRTGLALGDDEMRLATPLKTIHQPRGDALLDALVEDIQEQSPDELVIGLPLNMDGSDSKQAQITREFGEKLHERCGLKINYQDERLTSFAADQHMARSGRTHKQKKQIRDALAAAEILSDFLVQL
ncbi:MAG: Holliday junction resolvase RuvX [Planctomycetes bacterium]|nr:Holliday junction resolvase RuvX [Planctomycetota bacterium]